MKETLTKKFNELGIPKKVQKELTLDRLIHMPEGHGYDFIFDDEFIDSITIEDAKLIHRALTLDQDTTIGYILDCLLRAWTQRTLM